MDEMFEVVLTTKDGQKVKVVAYSNITGFDLSPGDMYIGKRNTGWQLAKCGKVHTEPGKYWVDSDPFAYIYSYDCGECRKVKEVIPL